MAAPAPREAIMNGPEHWREADLILTGESGSCEYGCPHSGCPHEMRLIARAQAHGLLALAAAVIAGTALSPAGRHEWQKAINPEYDAEVAAATAAARAEAQADPAGFGWAAVTP
jgi:hypothetical protein